jgi:glycosyltransferase involved in cell wall biosynthesis
MKKVYIEGLALVETHFSGIGQYVLGILKGLDELIGLEQSMNNKTPIIKVVIPYDKVKKFKSFGFRHIGYKTVPLSLRYFAGLDHRGKLFPIDLWCGRGFYIFTRFAAMPLAFSKYTAVVYDLSFELYSQFSDESNAKFLSPRTKATIASTDTIFTISQNAKKEIVDFYNVNESSVIVATPAADQKYMYRRDEKEIEKVKQKYGISGRYILSLSNLEPRKNLDGLVDAYCALPDSITKDVSLLLVGVNGWKTEKLFQKIINKVDEGKHIIRPSEYIDDKDKPAILSGAEMLVYPSHYEGFGMPPLEALACGTPVISANNSSLPEVVDTNTLQIDSGDTKAITAAIVQTINDTDRRKNAVSSGPLQAEKFSWLESAKKYYKVIMENV